MAAKPVGTIFSLFHEIEPCTSRHILQNGIESEINDLCDSINETTVQEVVSGGHHKSEASVSGRIIQGGSKCCITCGIEQFETDEERLLHYKSDWHRYNVKLRVQHRVAVSEAKFEEMLLMEDEVGSISGSDTEDDDDEKFQMKKGSSNSALAPYYLFEGMVGQDRKVLGIWKSLIMGMHENNVRTGANLMLNIEHVSENGQKWAVILARGGHFAGAIYKVRRPSEKVMKNHHKGAHELAELSMDEVEHKSFHRYVVRAKSGGKQSSKDATGKYARSAGSRLRRYNEAALQQDILNQLQIWKEELDACNLIFLACPGSNRKAFFAGESAPFMKDDQRIRKIPFVTRRPTLSEARRVLRTLLTVYDIDYSIQLVELENMNKNDKEVKSKSGNSLSRESKREAQKAELRKQQEEAHAKRKEKKKRQKERRKKLQAEQQKKEETETSEPVQSDDNEEINIEEELRRAAAAAMADSKPATLKSSGGSKSKASARQVKQKSYSSEELSLRRERLAAAAEARARALKMSSESQKLW